MGVARKTQNAAEAEFYDQAVANGWSASKRGWPDFFVCRGEEIAVVEVKTSHSRKLRREQMAVLEALAARGIPAFRWSPDGGFEPIEPISAVGGEGGKGGKGAVEVGSKTAKLQPQTSLWEEGSGGKPLSPGGSSPANSPEAAPSPPSSSDGSAEVDAVWAVYVAVMKPREQLAGEEERAVIRRALKVAGVDELETCIRECERSDYHMKRGQYVNRKGQVYKSISKILKPRPRYEETQRSRIDWWLDKAKASGIAGFPSADPAIVLQRQLEVQRGHQTDNPETVREAEVAEGWLSEHGIETLRGADGGIPTFRRKDVRGEV